MPLTVINYESPYDEQDLHDFLADPVTQAYCWKLTPRAGSIIEDPIGATSHTRDLVLPGHGALVFRSLGGIKPTAVDTEAGQESAGLNFLAVFDDSAITPLQLDEGDWDGARLEIYSINYAALKMGQFIEFSGPIGGFTEEGIVFEAQARPLTSLARIRVGRRASANCDVRVYGDTRCKLDLTDQTHVAIVSSASLFWKMNLVAGSVADISGTNPLTAVGSPTSISGKIGNAVGNLKGSNYLTGAAGSAHYPVSPGSEWTIHFWCKRSTAEDHTLVAGEAAAIAAHDTDFVLRWLITDRIKVDVSDSGSIQSAADSIPSDGAWHLVVFSYKHRFDGEDNVADLTLVIDNHSPVTNTITESTHLFGDLDSPLYVGSGRITTAGTVAHSIDALGIRHSIPTTPELAALWNSGSGAEIYEASSQDTLRASALSDDVLFTMLDGTVTFTTGENAGRSRVVRSWDPDTGEIVLQKAFPHLIGHGDHFIAVEGCDRTPAACTARDNIANFRGLPFITNIERFNKIIRA